MRTRGSCRFPTYYKAQWFDETSVAWRDVQKAHPTPEAARGEFRARPAARWRVMEVGMAGRQPLP